MLHDVSTLVPGVNGSIKGRGLNQRGLTATQRVALAAAVREGTLSVANLSAQQASTLFDVPVTVVDKEVKRRREDHLAKRAAALSDEAAYLVNVWVATDPEARNEAIKSIVGDALQRRQIIHVLARGNTLSSAVE